MRRRDLLALFGGTTLFPLAVDAQSPSKPALIGWLGSSSPPYAVRYQNYLREGLRENGEIEGQTFTLIGRFAEFRCLWYQYARTRARRVISDRRSATSGGVNLIFAPMAPAFLSQTLANLIEPRP